VDLGGNAVNYTFLDWQERFLIQELCEFPSRAREGPDVCLHQIVEGLEIAAKQAAVRLDEVAVVGLATPGPASAAGVLSARGSTNFLHPGWAGFDIRGNLAEKLGKPVAYLNDGNAGALWGHFSLFGVNARATSISAIIGTGLGGGVVNGGNVVKGRKGFGGELGHVLIPYQAIRGVTGLAPVCNCGRLGDLESVSSLTAIEKCLLPFFLARHPDHPLGKIGDVRQAAKLVRGLAENGDPMCREIFRVQAHALGLFLDVMINVFDPDALIIGGGGLEASETFQRWFVERIREAMPIQREEQSDILLRVMPNGDTAGARGAALEALQAARQSGVM
jgi:predicted NBD/HSP70 family sugar kinase